MNSKFLLGHFAWLAAVLGLLLVSCQRELDIDITERQTDATDSTVLKKFIVLDTTRQAPFDTINYESFVYDTDGRIKNSYVVFPNNPDIDTVSINTYFYHGSDTLPYKGEIIDAGDDIVLSSSGSSYWEYDNTGRLLKDSSIFISRDNPPSEDWEIRSGTFTYTPNGVNYHVRLKYYSVPGGPVSRETIIMGKVENTISNNCVVGQVDSIFYEYLVNNNGTLTADSTYSVNRVNLEYDANPNPFFKIFPAGIPVFNLDYYGFDYWEQPHNFKWGNSENRVYYSTGFMPPLGSQSSIHVFGYRSDGYPVVCWDTFTGGGTTFVEKYVFIYGG